MFIDLKKAFDTIDHSILISKLHTYGIRGVVLDWLTSYLKQQYVEFHGITLEYKNIDFHKAQSSHLSSSFYI